ncbi:MAG: hypothetical protein CVU23_13100, partial [Betaproteobacteria bacterium HGW-Betaproteobacteria-17]
ITVSFLPVLTLTGQEGKLFAPLAYTKTYAMAAGAALAVTLTPVLMGYLIRGRIAPETDNPANRFLQNAYRPLLMWALRRPRATVLVAALALASIAWPAGRAGSEFMPPLYEGDLLYMPTTLPGLSIDEAARILQITDRLILQMPEVERVFGKAGRADTATDPAPLSMLETTILLKPRDQWPPGSSIEGLISRLDAAVNLPGLTNSWGYPIRTRIDMLSTGVRSAVGVKITGSDLQGIVDVAQRIEPVVREVPGTRSVFAEHVTRGRYIDIEVDRAKAARYGVRVADVQNLVRTAIALLLQQPALAAEIEPPYLFAALRQPGIELLMTLIQLIRDRPGLTTGALLEHLSEHPQADALHKLALSSFPGTPAAWRTEFFDALARLDRLTIDQRVSELSQRQRE